MTMAWNTPGGKDKDPWTGRDQQQGPPELDEAWRKFWSNLKKLLQQKFNSSPQHSGRMYSFMTAAVLVVLFSIWFLSGVFIVSPAEQAVVLRFGRYVETVGAGPHWIPRLIDSKYIVNVGNVNQFLYGSRSEPVSLLTKDEGIVAVSAVVQYRINNPKEYLFNSSNPTLSLHQSVVTALHQVIGQTTLDELLAANQTVLSQQVKDQLTQILALYQSGIVITNVLMQPVQAPEEVKDKFEEANRAFEDEKRFVSQANAYAHGILPIAEGKANRLTEEAQAYKQKVILQAEGETQRFLALLPGYQRAPNIMKERLYLEAMESILSKTTKIVIDSSANNMIYLPIEQLMRTTENASVVTTGNNQVNAQDNNSNAKSKETSNSTSGYVSVAEERIQRQEAQRQQRENNRGVGDR